MAKEDDKIGKPYLEIMKGATRTLENARTVNISIGSGIGPITLLKRIRRMEQEGASDEVIHWIMDREFAFRRSQTRSSVDQKFLDRATNLADLFLEPDNAESAIANLTELYDRRLKKSPQHAKIWLVVQLARIVFGASMEVMRSFARARAGK